MRPRRAERLIGAALAVAAFPQSPRRVGLDRLDEAEGLRLELTQRFGRAPRAELEVVGGVVPDQLDVARVAGKVALHPDLVERELAVGIGVLLGGEPLAGLVVADLPRALARDGEPVDVALQPPLARLVEREQDAPLHRHRPLLIEGLIARMLSRVIHGTRISLMVGVSSVVLALFVGVPLGMIAGFYGGRVDLLVMRVMDLILAFPIYLLAVILMVMFTPTAGLIGIVKVTGAIAIVRIPIYARLVRGSVLSVREKEYIEACRALGVRDGWILFRHVLPNCLAPIIVTTTLGIATSIIVEATLSFLGLGTQPPTPSWGWDLKANVAFIQDNAWLALFPGLAIFVTVLGFNLFGDGLRDALDPRLK